MRIEISAGGVIIKYKRGRLHILLLRDKNGSWTFPKGLVDKREKAEEGAKREIKEEVGLEKIDFVAKLAPIQYWYRFKNDLIKKTVYYFLFKELADEEPKPQKEEGINEAKWFPMDEALEMVGYQKTNKKILEEVKESINSKRKVQSSKQSQ